MRGGYLGRTHIGLDYFDASIHRVMPHGSSARVRPRKSALLACAARADSTACASYEIEGDYDSAASPWSRKLKTPALWRDLE